MDIGRTLHSSFAVLLMAHGALAASAAAKDDPVASAPRAEASSASKWVPKGWKLIRSASGDLNKDGKDDTVLVLEQDDPANRKPNDGLGSPVLNLNPRRLVILMKTPSGHEAVLSKDGFIPSENDAEAPCLADPFLESGDIGVTRGALKIDLHYWLSCGSYGVSHSTFTFRHDAERFQLIGLDEMEFSRSTGEQSKYSTNFLTGKKKATTGLNAFEASRPTTTWSNIPSKRKFYLDEMTLSCDPAEAQSWCH